MVPEAIQAAGWEKVSVTLPTVSFAIYNTNLLSSICSRMQEWLAWHGVAKHLLIWDLLHKRDFMPAKLNQDPGGWGDRKVNLMLLFTN